MLNAVCGDLARQVNWHGRKLCKDSWRHFLSGTAAGWLMVPAYNNGDGREGFVMLGSSSLKLTKAQATVAIEMGLHIGNAPWEQGLSCACVKWSEAVLRGTGWNPKDLEQ